METIHHTANREKGRSRNEGELQQITWLFTRRIGKRKQGSRTLGTSHKKNEAKDPESAVGQLVSRGKTRPRLKGDSRAPRRITLMRGEKG